MDNKISKYILNYTIGRLKNSKVILFYSFTITFNI